MKIVSGVLAAVGLLCACSGGGAAVGNTSAVVSSTPPSATTTPTVVASPTVPTTGPNVLPGATVPVMPAEAKQHSARGALVFAASIAQALDWAYSTTDSTILKQYYSPNCPTCPMSLSRFRQTKQNGWHYKGGHLSLRSAQQKGSSASKGGEYSIDLTIASTELQVLDATDRVVQGPFKPQVATLRYGVTWESGEWVVVLITRVGDSE